MSTAPMLWPIASPLAEPPRPGSGALLPTLGRSVTEVGSDREVAFTFRPEQCGVSGVGPGDNCAQTSAKTIPTPPQESIEAWDFFIWAGDPCRSALDFAEDGWRDRALRQLRATMSYQVAHEFWTGTEAKAMSAPTPYLADELTTDTLTAGPTAPNTALQFLEEGLRLCNKGARGAIHATPSALTAWAELSLVRREGQMILTALDTVVIADAGYDGSGPSGQAAIDGSQWAYASGMPIVRLGPEYTVPDTLGEALNRATNTVEWRAERKAAVAYDGCCSVAVEINLPWPDVGGVGS